MIKFLETEEISACLKRIIKNSEKELFIVSPYLKVRDKLKSYLEETIFRNIEVTFIYRQSSYEKNEQWFSQIANRNVSLIVNDLVHAKCYMNESEAIITSMNFYEYSQDHNYEMGILVTKEEPMFREIQRSVDTIINHSQQKLNIRPGGGYCIRCKESIEMDPNKPYCYTCYLMWAEYDNPHYTESYCHSCGAQEPSSMMKPLCYDCYSNNFSKW